MKIFLKNFTPFKLGMATLTSSHSENTNFRKIMIIDTNNTLSFTISNRTNAPVCLRPDFEIITIILQKVEGQTKVF